MMYKMKRFVRQHPWVSLLIACALLLIIFRIVGAIIEQRKAARSVSMTKTGAASTWAGLSKTRPWQVTTPDKPEISSRNPVNLFAAAN